MDGVRLGAGELLVPSLSRISGWMGPASGKKAKVFNAASGGTESTVSNYNGTGQTWKVHQFTSSGTLTVTVSAEPFDVLVVGGGGSGGYNTGGGGGAGEVTRTTLTLAPQAHSVTINGAGGTSVLSTVTARAGTAGGANAGAGGNSYQGATTYYGGAGSGGIGGGGGGAGASGNGQGPPSGGTNTAGGPGVSDTITGSSVTYASGGNALQNGNTTSPYKGGGGGGGAAGAGGQAGQPGIVVVAYRIG